METTADVRRLEEILGWTPIRVSEGATTNLWQKPDGRATARISEGDLLEWLGWRRAIASVSIRRHVDGARYWMAHAFDFDNDGNPLQRVECTSHQSAIDALDAVVREIAAEP